MHCESLKADSTMQTFDRLLINQDLHLTPNDMGSELIISKGGVCVRESMLNVVCNYRI